MALAPRDFTLLLFASMAFLGEPASAVSPAESRATTVESQIFKAVDNDPLLHELTQVANEFGGRVWIWGGSASSTAWRAVHPEIPTIPYLTQDLDLAIDAPREALPQMTRRIRNVLRVHGISDQAVDLYRNGKDLTSGGFHLDGLPEHLFRLHSDSMSVTMIELTGSPGVERVLDRRGGGRGAKSVLIKSLVNDEIEYLPSLFHRVFRGDETPEIISVIRFLTKAFRHDLRISPASEPLIRAVIDRFDPEKISSLKPSVQNYLRKWITYKAPKLLMTETGSIEKARAFLVESGLGDKLLAYCEREKIETFPTWWRESTHHRTGQELVIRATGMQAVIEGKQSLVDFFFQEILPENEGLKRVGLAAMVVAVQGEITPDRVRPFSGDILSSTALKRAFASGAYHPPVSEIVDSYFEIQRRLYGRPRFRELKGVIGMHSDITPSLAEFFTAFYRKDVMIALAKATLARARPGIDFYDFLRTLRSRHYFMTEEFLLDPEVLPLWRKAQENFPLLKEANALIELAQEGLDGGDTFHPAAPIIERERLSGRPRWIGTWRMSTLDHPANPNVPLEEMMRRIELAVRIRPEFGNTREFYVTLHRADVREYWRAHPQALEAVIDSLFMEEDALWGPIEILADPDWIGVKTPLWKKIALRAAKDLEVAVRKESDYGRKTHFEKWRALLEAHPELKEFYAEIAPGVDPADTDGAGAQRLAAIAARITGNPCPALLKPVPPLE